MAARYRRSRERLLEMLACGPRIEVLHLGMLFLDVAPKFPEIALWRCREREEVVVAAFGPRDGLDLPPES